MERFVNDVLVKLDCVLSGDEIKMVRNALLEVIVNYDISPRCTDIVLASDVLSEEVKHYLVAKKIEGMTDGTLKVYYDALKRFSEKVRKATRDIRTEDIRLYLYSLSKERHMSDRTLENQRSYISSFFRWAAANGYIDKDPTAAVGRIKFEKKIRKPLNDTELERLRMACKTKREKAIIDVLYSTGCRVSELTGIKVEDIDFESREVQLYGKGKKQRIGYLNAKAIINIRAMIGSRGYESEYVFANDRAPHGRLCSRSIENVVSRLGKEANISKVYPHRIRHTTATDALKRGMAVEEVQKLLGHEKIETTLIYAEVSREEVKEKHSKYIV